MKSFKAGMFNKPRLRGKERSNCLAAKGWLQGRAAKVLLVGRILKMTDSDFFVLVAANGCKYKQ